MGLFSKTIPGATFVPAWTAQGSSCDSQLYPEWSVPAPAGADSPAPAGADSPDPPTVCSHGSRPLFAKVGFDTHCDPEVGTSASALRSAHHLFARGTVVGGSVAVVLGNTHTVFPGSPVGR